MPKLSVNPCRIKPNPVWYEIEPDTSHQIFFNKNEEEVEVDVQDQDQDQDQESLHQLSLNTKQQNDRFEKGKAFLMEDSKLYEKFQSQQNSSQSRMNKMFLKGGTLTDRISVLTLSIQHSPVHHLEALEKLVAMVGKKNRTEAMLALSALQDLFTGTGLTQRGLLPADRKLVSFAQRPTFTSAMQCALWVFEDQLKQLFFKFLAHLEHLLRDTVAYAKKQAMKCILALLVHGPEQEANLLQLLIHKLGDPSPLMATFASYSITQLLTVHHPAMRPVVCEACRQFLLKPSTPIRAHYYTLITVNQIVLSKRGESDLAVQMVEFYFERIQAHLQKTEALEKEERGLVKVQHERKKQMKRLKNKKKLVVPPPTASSHSENEDDENKDENKDQENKLTKKEALRQKKEDLIKLNKLLSAILNGLHRAIPFLDLPKLPESWVHHLNQLFFWTHHEEPVVQLHALYVLFYMQRIHVDLEDRFATSFYAFLQDLTRRTMPLPVQSMFLVLFRKVLLFWIESKTQQRDKTLRTVTAWLVRALDICLVQIQSGWVVAMIGMLEEMLGRFPALKHSLVTPTPTNFAPHLSRVPDALPGTPFFHLHFLLHHYHPSVRCFAEKFLQLHPFELAKEIQGDPLHLFSLVRFLDHFAEKKPKPIRPEKSIHAKSVPMETILHGKQHTLDQEFLKHYASVKPASKKPRAKESVELDEDNDGEETDEEEIEKAIKTSMSKVHGVDLDNFDEDDDDFDDEEDDDDFDDDDDEDEDEDEETFSDDEVDNQELHFSEEDVDEDEEEEGPDRRRRSAHHIVPSVPLSGTPFASAQAYSELLESQLGLEDDLDNVNEANRYKQLQKMKRKHEVLKSTLYKNEANGRSKQQESKQYKKNKGGSKQPPVSRKRHASKGGPPSKKKKF